MNARRAVAFPTLVIAFCVGSFAADPREVSGVYPHLAYFNDEGECGTGAVVPWADRLWLITYGPHSPNGSTDKLYEVTPDLQRITRPESIGGTAANRLIHRESNQLFIGPYVIDAERHVRAIPYARMFGRHTGCARHLEEPAGKIYYATMEEGLYEVDVETLAVTALWSDEQVPSGRHANLPGYHGKGLCSGQGRVVYANNGEHGEAALTHPDTPSGCLAEWDGRTNEWRVVRRNQFTEVTGPGGIRGNEHPATDPIWSIGWDHRSLILMALDHGRWHAYRLPKASHCYDGAHGWNTEWPRIRDIGEPDLLMTMHGMFWQFPRNFSATNSAGIAPCSTYLKVIGDFCRWNGRVVFGCDDTARSEFRNQRRAKGKIAPPGQSQSNLWFVEPSRLRHLGAPLGRGAVWLDEPVAAGAPSEPFLFAGFERRSVHLAADVPVTFTIEVDIRGNGQWTRLRDVSVDGYTWAEFAPDTAGTWVRVLASRDCGKATAFFQYSNPPPAAPSPAGAPPTTSGLLRALGENKRALGFATDAGYYEMGADLELRRVEDPGAGDRLKKEVAIPQGALLADAASLLYVDESGRRWRLPGCEPGGGRICREVCTERDLLHADSTFYELPAENAGGFAKIRPVATHEGRVADYCSYRGLLVISGMPAAAPHLVRSDDGQASLWVGAVDDLWQLGKPRGTGGPWKNTPTKSGAPSDPYLMTGFDRKALTLTADAAIEARVEVDITGTGLWRTWQTLKVDPDRPTRYLFPAAFSAYWVRVTASRDCIATALFEYE